MTLTQITTHEADARARLLEQFKNQYNIESILNAFSEQIQALENPAFDMLSSMRLQNATGATLNRWGNTLGVPRAGRDDITYRAALFFRTLESIATGSPNEILDIVSTLFEAESTQIFEYFPAAISINIVNAQNLPDPTYSANLVQSICPAAVALLYIAVGETSPYFAFFGYPASGALGFDDYLTPTNEGGQFLTVIV